MAPGMASPHHVHRNEDEAFYILEGTVAFLCGDAWHVAGPNTWVFGPRDIPHGFRVIGSTPARMLLQCAPAGFERFVRELSLPVDATPSLPDLAVLIATAARYGIEILGPAQAAPQGLIRNLGCDRLRILLAAMATAEGYRSATLADEISKALMP